MMQAYSKLDKIRLQTECFIYVYKAKKLENRFGESLIQTLTPHATCISVLITWVCN